MSNRTLYIIDDEQQTVDLISEFAKLLGYPAITYTDATKFFANELTHEGEAIVILDLNMPGMDGIEVMRQMVKTRRKIPLVLISGYDAGVLHSAEQLAKAHNLNIIATLSKPFEFGLFKKVIERHTNTERRQSPRPELYLTAGELEEAILQGQLICHYQPKVDMESGNMIGVEALVRWQHPLHGLIYPNSFISLAENNELIGDLTAHVIRTSVQQALDWQSQGLHIQISVNISAENITSLSLPEQLSLLLKRNDLNPSMITLEITESALMGQLATSLDILTRLRMKGIKLSIDDFGTGYSSLSQLYRMPFTELKVDQSFVMNITSDDEAYGIVKTCIMLGHELNMTVVAEGVEDKETLMALKKMGCDIAQGYYFAKPMPAEDIVSWNKNRRIDQ